MHTHIYIDRYLYIYLSINSSPAKRVHDAKGRPSYAPWLPASGRTHQLKSRLPSRLEDARLCAPLF